jgi:hypothetical protein
VTTYRSKVDWWMWPALLMPVVGGAATTIGGIAGAGALSIGLGLGVLAFYGALMGGLVLPLRYTIEADRLEVRAGLVRTVIPWERLISVETSSNPISGPALSLKRLYVCYTKKSGVDTWVLISPTDRDAFMGDVASASPLHELRDGKVQRN